MYPNWDFWFENKPSGNPEPEPFFCQNYVMHNFHRVKKYLNIWAAFVIFKQTAQSD
jgi:hypothetical protein